MRRLDTPGPIGNPITIEVDGKTVPAREGESVATALLVSGERIFSRSVKYHRPRGAFCMSGTCSHCLMRVDGVPNVQTCCVDAKAGMHVERQNAFPSATFDLLSASDWLFPRGMDHHELFAGTPLAEELMTKVARHLAGLGELPDEPAPARAPAQELTAKVVIVGAGAAGLYAASTLLERGVDFALLERSPVAGGRLAHGAPRDDDPPLPLSRQALGARLTLRSTALGLYNDGGAPFIAACASSPAGPRLMKVRADRFLIATGGAAQLLPFENNDLPGIYSSHAAAKLVRADGVLVGAHIVLAGFGAELASTERLLTRHGGNVVAVVDRGELARAHGPGHVRAVSILLPGGEVRRLRCDALVLCAPRSPSFELARHGGAGVRFDERSRLFAVEADASGRTQVPWLFAAGELLGELSCAESARSGERAALAIAADLEEHR